MNMIVRSSSKFSSLGGDLCFCIIAGSVPRLGTSVCSVVRPSHCRNSCNFCRKSGNFDSKFRKIGEKKLRKVQKSGCSKKPRKECESSKILPNLGKIRRLNDPENEISSQKCGSPRGGGVKFLQKLQKFDFSDF